MPPARVGLRRHPQAGHQARLADVQRGDPLDERARLLGLLADRHWWSFPWGGVSAGRPREPRAKQGNLNHALEVALHSPRASSHRRSWYEQDFRSERTVLGRALRAYVDGLRRHLSEAFRVVAPGGVVVYSVANTVRAGRVFDLAGGFRELLTEAGFTDVHATTRVQEGRRILPAGRNPCTGRFTGGVGNAGVREYVVLGRRP